VHPDWSQYECPSFPILFRRVAKAYQVNKRFEGLYLACLQAISLVCTKEGLIGFHGTTPSFPDSDLLQSKFLPALNAAVDIKIPLSPTEFVPLKPSAVSIVHLGVQPSFLQDTPESRPVSLFRNHQ
jgi:hypothetical protein